MVSDQEFARQLQDLTEKFTAGLPDQLGAIQANWTRIWREGRESTARDILIQQVHALEGAAGSLGFKQITQSAKDFQLVLKNYAKNPDMDMGQVKIAYQILQDAIYTDQQIHLNDLIQHLDSLNGKSVNLQEKRSHRLIYIIDDDPIQVADLAAQVGYFGYAVQIFNSLNNLEEAIRENSPTVLLMDISFPEGRMAGYDLIEELQKKISNFPPVIFVSVNDEITFRLQAVRVGGKAYFTKPVDVGLLIDVIDRLIFQDNVVPYRVLIVEDSQVQANYISVQLQQAEIIAEIVSNPLQVIDHLISFNPDLLLLDMYMPQCTGMEMAQIIRQMEQFVSMPIVFLSAETDKDKQLAAIGIGGDDFLTKPIEPDHLIAAVSSRIERYRKLRTFMIHDGLTGLLNHSTTKERLIQEVERARRQNEPLAFAMLDMDNFKQVNDHFGHASGDRVLKSLAHMLRQRLRDSDTIGRFGGEEFAVILPNTTEKQAISILQELCDGFAMIRHRYADQEFSVTFSCGIASFPNYDQPGTLAEAADMAMYAAKAAGRNQVVPASLQTDKEPASNIAQPIKTGQAGQSQSIPDLFLIQQARITILRLDAQGTITNANRFSQQIFGYTEPELIGKSATETLFHLSASSRSGFETMLTEIVHHPEQIDNCEIEIICKDGKKVRVAWIMIPFQDQDYQVNEILCVGIEITDRKEPRTEYARALSYLAAINHISQTVITQPNIHKAVGTITQEVVTLFKAQHVGIGLLTEDRTALEFIGNSPAGWGNVRDQNNLVYLCNEPASEQVVHGGKALFVPDARHNSLLAETRTLMQEHEINGRGIIPLVVSGKVIGTMNIDFKDPERKFDESELDLAATIAGSIAGMIELSNLFNAEQRQRQFFEALVENLPVAVEIIDPQANIQSWNPAAKALFGYTAEEAIGRNIDELLASAEMRLEAVGYTQKSMQEGERIHSFTSRQRKDGSLVEVEVFAIPLYRNERLLGSLAIYHDISQLQQARHEAEAANEAKSSFLATMSHEIRTPLNAIVGMTTLLLDTQLTQEQLNFTDTIRGSSDALLTIINDILDFSKIEAGRMELEEQPFDLRECIESAFDLVAAKATEKGIDLAYQMDPAVPSFVISDSTRLRQILLNLLGNSLKFTNSGEIVLSVSIENPISSKDDEIQMHFSVRDTGIGIPSDRKDRLFRSFSQVDASTTRKYGGTGLGLAISKRLSELMGGTMWVESEGIPGEGSTFHFTTQVRRSTIPVPIFLNARQPELSGRRVLIVDDNATNRYILIRQVQSWGMDPQETSDPRQALNWILEGRTYDVALLDMQMPEMDGVTLATEIQRRESQQASLPLIMLTSLGIKDINKEEVNFAAFLTKPIKPAVLYSTLLAVLSPQKAGRNGVRVKAKIEPSLEPVSNLRILMAEDITVNQKVGLLLMERIGYKADVVGNGLEVLEALHRQMYDVILMDVQMPEMDGMEASRAVRSGLWLDSGTSRSNVQPYIIAMTANAMQGDREACLAAGMDDYISKPIQIEDLAKALNRAAKTRKSGISIHQEIPGGTIQQVINENVFQKFQSSLGVENRQVVVSLITDFLSEGEHLVSEIHTEAINTNSEKVRQASHSLKSTSQMFGALDLAQTCEEIETNTRCGSLENITLLIERLDQNFEAVQKALLEWIKS